MSSAEEAFIPMGKINQYDVFLSHNSADKEAVENIAQRLRQEANLQPFLDKWHLIPGQPWQEKLEKALDQSRTCAVFLGPSGLGSWENEEMRDALDQRVRDKYFRVIPILLPGADPKDKTTLPRFLRRLIWVDFRQGLEDTEAFHRLSCGIKGIPPEASKRAESQDPDKPILPIWNVPYRQNPYFTGRKELLKTLHQKLTTEHTTALTQTQAITGLGGIGKTQTAIEYAYRHQKDYQIIWWLRAGELTTLAADYAQLTIKLDLPEYEATEQAIQIQTVRNWLEQHAGWLLIFDNAEERHNIRPYLPQMGNGHVLITSRNPIWDGLGTTLPVEVMQPREALAFLAKRTNDSDTQAAKKLAKTLGYLPLALEQATAYIRETSISLDHYQALFQKHHAQLLQHGHLATEYPDTVATTWELSFQKVQRTSPAAADFLNLCAFLAPDAIFLDMVIEGATYVPKRLAKTIKDPLTLNKLIGTLLHYSLLQREGNTLTIHRLVQSVLRDRLKPNTQRRWAEHAVQIVNQAFPESEFTTWTRCEQLLSHAQICIRWVEKWDLISEEAGHLLHQIGLYLYDRVAYTEAEPLYQQARAIYEKVLGSDHPSLADTLNDLALLYKSQGHYAEAKPLYQQARAIYEKVLGPDHSYLAITLGNLATLYKEQGHYVEAEPLYQQARTIKEKALGPDHPSLAATLGSLARLYVDQGRYTEAEPLYQQDLTITKKALGPNHPDLASTLSNLALLYTNQGRYAEAEPLYQQARTIKEKALGSDHPYLASTLGNLALLYTNQGRYAEAEPLYQQAQTIKEKALGPNHPELVATLENYATLLHKTARDTEATALETRAQAIRAQQAEKNPTN